MSVLKDKKKFAFVDDESIDTNEMPKNLQELNKGGRGVKKDELRLRAKNANLPMNAYIVVKLFGVK